MSQGYEDLTEWLAARLLIKEDIEEDEKDIDYGQYVQSISNAMRRK